MKTEKEFWSHVKKAGPDECWEWQLCKGDKGYGMLEWKGKHTRAHRVAESLHSGKPMGPPVLHTCDHPPCCNPKHLFRGTIAINNRDMWAKGRGRIPPGRKFQPIPLPDRIVRQLGTMPDYLLARKAGTNKSTIARRRGKAGIAPYALTSGCDGKYKPGNYPARWLRVVS